MVVQSSFPRQMLMLYVRGFLDRSRPRVLVTDLCFTEGPRWRDGRLFISDMHAGEVIAISADDGSKEVIATLPDPGPQWSRSKGVEPAALPGMASGLGFLPDGRLLVVSMQDRRIKQVDAAGVVSDYADLSAIATGPCNDMLVDGSGRAYVGNFGWDLYDPELLKLPKHICHKKAALALVDAAGKTRVVADGLDFPNGMVITPDGGTLIVAETFGSRLTAFDIDQSDGSLSHRRVWASLPFPPDGICLDEEGCIWAACPVQPGFAARIGEGGRVKQLIRSDRGVYAVMLGGSDGKELFMLEAKEDHPARTASGNSRVRSVRVDAGRAAGWP